MLDGFSYSVMGASHEKRGIVCQDASAYKVGNGFAAAVVADGHGGKKYFRSNVGSQCAVEAALETVEYFYSDPEFEEHFKTDHKRLVKRIEKYTIMLWNEKIMHHFDTNPLTSEELNRFSYDEFEEIPPESYYGTTLVCAVIANGYSWGFQIGDGSLVAVFDDGETSMIMDYEEANPANITSSMCNANASDMFDAFFIEKKRPVAIIVSTDGLYTSFGSDADFLNYHTIIGGQLAKPEAFLGSLQNNMKKRSHYGTEDDISVSCIYDKELAVSKQAVIKNKIEENKRLAAERKAKLLNK